MVDVASRRHRRYHAVGNRTGQVVKHAPAEGTGFDPVTGTNLYRTRMLSMGANFHVVAAADAACGP